MSYFSQNKNLCRCRFIFSIPMKYFLSLLSLTLAEPYTLERDSSLVFKTGARLVISHHASYQLMETFASLLLCLSLPLILHVSALLSVNWVSWMSAFTGDNVLFAEVQKNPR